jgi:4-alpha-glucanotransferase
VSSAQRERERGQLQELAMLHGVEPAYYDMLGRRVAASEESLFAAASALAGPLEGMDDVAEALAARHAELAAQLIEPVLVAWDGRLTAIELRLPPAAPGGTLACHLDLENGERHAWTWDVDSLPAIAPSRRRLALPEALPPGYHHLEVKLGGRAARALVIAAPVRAFGADGGPLWGVFLPLYALRTARSWGAGDLTDLRALAAWTGALGGDVVASLPLLATFLDVPFEPSPYAPASRLFWNETYLDPRQLPEAALCPAARRLLESTELAAEMRTLAELPLVDYARLATLKRRVLEEMVAWSFANAGPRRQDLERCLAARPELADYAAFRAVGDRRGESWQDWPERLRDGHLAPADYDEEDYRYHLWAQWAMEQQLAEAAGQGGRRNLEPAAQPGSAGLYLDMPVGVHGSGYDVWRMRDVFAAGASAGAPPDAFFTKGQDWGFPPLRPERLRERGYDYLIAVLRHHLRHAEALRLDHVMQLHRLFWVPRGLGPEAGVYVRYPHEELYAVLSLESHRHRAMIVGENLGTVPPEVNESMARHGVLGMYVMQYELAPGGGGLQREPPPASVAGLNTHDMPTFRGFWEGRDVDDLQALGFLDERQAREERQRRAAQLQQLVGSVLAHQPSAWDGRSDPFPLVLRACLEHLAAGPARMVLVNLEDLWQETEPQNVPGTRGDQRPNWRRKARLTFEEMTRRPEVAEMLGRIDQLRRGSRRP